MGVGQIVDQNSDEKRMGVQYRLCLVVDQDCDGDKEKKMGFGRIVEQNSEEKRWVYSIDYVEQQIRFVMLMKKK